MIELENLIVFRHGMSLHNQVLGRVLGNECQDLEWAFQELRRVSEMNPGDVHWPLTDRGLRQARFASEVIQAYVQPLGPCAYITSPLVRSLHTAYIVFPRVVWQEDVRARERDWGDTSFGFECVHAFREAHAEMVKKASQDQDFIPGQGGGSVTAHIPEVQSLLAELEERHRGGTVVISSHGEISKVIRHVLAGARSENWPAICKNTGMHNLNFLHFRKGPSGKLEQVRRLNPLTYPMELPDWQPILPT